MNKPTDKEVREYMLKNKVEDYFVALEILERMKKGKKGAKMIIKAKKGDSKQ